MYFNYYKMNQIRIIFRLRVWVGETIARPRAKFTIWIFRNSS